LLEIERHAYSPVASKRLGRARARVHARYFEEERMKLSHTLTLAGLGVGALILAVAQGCSSSSSPSGGGGGNGSAGGPPAKPSAGATTVTTEHNFALYSLLLGDTDRSGVTNRQAWMNFGYNLDGKASTKDSTDTCTLAAGASKTAQLDGNNGIDNSFGENILPIIQSTAGSDASKKINDSIQQGHFTVMIDTVGLDDSSTTQTATGLSAKLYAGANFDAITANTGKQPTFTPVDDWPVRPELLSSPGDVTSSKVKFGDSYVVNGTFVSQAYAPGTSSSDITLSLTFSGVALDLTVHAAVITFDHAAGAANNGTIAGVIKTDELISGLKTVAGRISTSLCSGSAFDSIAAEIKQASDIMHDGTNAAGTACDGISIGLGFIGKEIGKPKDIASITSPSPDPCATDGGATD
jgi:hypothetical protein